MPRFTGRERICSLWILLTLLVIAAATVAIGPAKSPTHNGRASVAPAGQTFPAAAVTAARNGRISANYGALPLVFEENEGQTDPQVKYTARTSGYTLFLTPQDVVLSLHSPSRTERSSRPLAPQHHERSAPTSDAVIRMHLLGANSAVALEAGGRLSGQTNYYIGNDPSLWHTGVAQYGHVDYKNIYPGVDMAFHGHQRQFEFDFNVAPGASPKAIELQLAGARRVWTDAAGNLLLSSSAGDLILHKPVAYQETDDGRRLVDAAFVVKNKNNVTFALGPYDRSRELVIDPALTYSTYLGGGIEDEAFAIAVDAAGNAYITGQTNSLNFPAKGGTVQTLGAFDAFVTKLDPTGSLVFTTLLGGGMDDTGLGIAVNSIGNYVIGNTSSSNFPSLTILGVRGGQDVFVVRLDNTTGMASPERVIVAGSNVDSGNSIAVDSSGNAYIAGGTSSTDFPTKSPFQAALSGPRDGFVAKLDPAGITLVYSTYLGGSGKDTLTGIAMVGGNAYVTGLTDSTDFPTTPGAFKTTAPGAPDGFVSEIKADGSALVYSTYLGGTAPDNAFSIAVDPAGEAYVTGTTDSDDFPVANAAQGTRAGLTDGFVTKLNASGSGLLFSTYLGGSLDDTPTAIALDPFNDAYVTGVTSSSNFPTSGSPFQSNLSGPTDAFVTELSNSGFFVYSSYLGGKLGENSVGSSSLITGSVAVDLTGNAYLTGSTTSANVDNFPLKSAFQTTYGGDPADAFVTKVAAAPKDFSISVSPVNISTTSGQTSSAVTVTVSSVNASFGGAVNLSCSGLPAQAACNFVKTSLTPTGTPATTTVTISTNGSPGNARLSPPILRNSGILYAMLLPLGGLALLGVRLSPRRRKILGFLLFASVAAILFVLPSCGGGSSPNTGGGCSAAASVPIGLAASSTTTTGTTLKWSAATAPSGCSVTGYTVYQNGTKIGITATPTLAVTGLSPSTPYSFTVAASDSFGPSAQSAALSVTTGASCTAAPSAPTGLTPSSITSSGTTLTWSAVTAPPGCSITGYAVYQNGTLIGTPANTNFAVTGLSPGTTYSFTVAADDSFGRSPQSSAKTVTTATVNTPPGTYTITVTGTDANNASHFHSVQLTLKVN